MKQPAVWITMMIVVILALNTLAVSVFGEVEFYAASIKLITILGLLILSVVIILGGGPSRDRLGFRYWKDPGGISARIHYNFAGDISDTTYSDERVSPSYRFCGKISRILQSPRLRFIHLRRCGDACRSEWRSPRSSTQHPKSR